MTKDIRDTFKWKYIYPIKWTIWDAYRSTRNALVRARVKLVGGYSCDCCGRKLAIHWTEIKSTVNGRAFILSNGYDNLLCSRCLLQNIEMYFRDHVKPEEGSRCEWFPEVKSGTIDIIWGLSKNDPGVPYKLDIRFGSGWWNGQSACLQVFRDALTSDTMQYTTSIISYEKGKAYYVDMYGIKVSYGNSTLFYC